MIDKKEMLDKFSKIKLKNTGFVICSKKNDYWKYLSDNNVDSLYDLYNLYKKEYELKKFTCYSAKNLGILNLCLYKYFGIYRKGFITLLDSDLGFYEYASTKKVLERTNHFCLLGLDILDIKTIYGSRVNGKKIIDYLREFVSYDVWDKDKLNIFNLLIEYYDTYYLRLNNSKEKKV